MFELIGQITVAGAVVAGGIFAYKKGWLTLAYDKIKAKWFPEAPKS